MTPLYKTKPFHKKYFIITKKQTKKERKSYKSSICMFTTDIQMLESTINYIYRYTYKNMRH